MNLGKVSGFFKKILPDRVTRFISGLFYGWHGNFSSWEEALKLSSGYNSPVVLEKVTASARKLRTGIALYERDSVLFDEIEYSFPVLAGLLWVAAQNNGRLNVMDFGGSFGSSYFQNKMFLDSLKEFNWCIVEQPNFTEIGQKEFSDEKLHFFNSISECTEAYHIEVVLISSVLQYLKEPFKFLESLKSQKIKYLIIDRTPFIDNPDRITIQKVHPAIYKATYPCWFFNKKKFVSALCTDYELILEFDALDKANIPSEFKGFIFKLKSI